MDIALRDENSERTPDSTRWSLVDVTGCGQRGYMRPCQVHAAADASPLAYPMASICETGAEGVIVVDDEADLCRHLAELIESLGYSAVPCGSSSELQDVVPRFKSGCIVLDIKLPGLDGIAVQEWLTKSEITLPVIFISGVRDVDTVVQGMKGGAIEFLAKPISEMALLRAVNAAVAKSRMIHCARQSVRQISDMVATLTPTELVVAKKLAQGYPTKLIAASLGRSENTVKIHRHRIFSKLKIHSSASVANIISHAGY